MSKRKRYDHEGRRHPAALAPFPWEDSNETDRATDRASEMARQALAKNQLSEQNAKLRTENAELQREIKELHRAHGA